MTPPRYQDIKAADIPEVVEDDGTKARILCGELWGQRGPVDGIAADPSYVDISVPPNTRRMIPVETGRHAFAYVFAGSGRFLGASDPYRAPAEWIDPELAPESLPEVAARVTGRPVAVKTVRLLHHPVYVGKVVLADATHALRVDGVGGQLIDADWPVRSAFTYRNRAWMATAAMVAVAAVLPLPAAAVLVIAIGGLSARLLWRRSAVPTTAAT